VEQEVGETKEAAPKTPYIELQALVSYL
jgi:hypothetical protein